MRQWDEFFMTSLLWGLWATDHSCLDDWRLVWFKTDIVSGKICHLVIQFKGPLNKICPTHWLYACIIHFLGPTWKWPENFLFRRFIQNTVQLRKYVKEAHFSIKVYERRFLFCQKGERLDCAWGNDTT